MATKYKEEEIIYLRKIADQTDLSNSEITRLFNKKFNKDKTIASMTQMKSKLGIKSYTRKYTEEHKEFLRSVAPGRNRKEITKIFNEKFKQDRTVGSIKSVMFENDIKTGNDTRFKKGRKPTNTMSVGAEVKRTDGYFYVKIGQPNDWELKHRLIWEKHNGKILDGNVIIFKDGNNQKLDIENLEMVSREKLLTINQLDLIKEDAELTKTGLLLADLLIKIREVRR